MRCRVMLEGLLTDVFSSAFDLTVSVGKMPQNLNNIKKPKKKKKLIFRYVVARYPTSYSSDAEHGLICLQ